MPAGHIISPHALMNLLGTPRAPIIVDVSIDTDFALDPTLIPTAFRHPFSDLPALPPERAGRPVVAVCQKGRKLSQGAAALLRSVGVPARVLTGGNHGWRDAKLPRIPVAALPAQSDGPTLWVTAHRPNPEALACAWLIRRFVDPKARFLFVPEDDTADVSEKFGATLFGTRNQITAGLSRHGPFDALIARFALDCPPLNRFAQLVRSSDLDQHGPSPQAGGWQAVATGLSRLHKDDMPLLDAALLLCDALYSCSKADCTRQPEHTG